MISLQSVLAENTIVVTPRKVQTPANCPNGALLAENTILEKHRKIQTAPSEKCSFSTFWFVKVINLKIPNIKIPNI